MRLAALWMVVLALPAAAADLAVHSVQGPEQALQADGLPQKVVVTFDIACSDLPPPAAQPTYTIDAQVVAPQGITVAGPRRAEFSNACTPALVTSMRASMNFQVSAAFDATGEVPLPITFELSRTSPGSPLAGNATASGSTMAWVRFRGLVSVRVPDTILEGRPGDIIAFPMHLTNMGNAEASVRLFVLDDGSGQLVGHVPPPVLLGRPGQGEDNGTAIFSVHGPEARGRVNYEQPFTVRLTPVSVRDGDAAGAPVDVQLLVRVRSEPAAAPAANDSPAPGLALLLTLALAAARRRQRAHA